MKYLISLNEQAAAFLGWKPVLQNADHTVWYNQLGERAPDMSEPENYIQALNNLALALENSLDIILSPVAWVTAAEDAEGVIWELTITHYNPEPRRLITNQPVIEGLAKLQNIDSSILESVENYLQNIKID